MSIEEKITEELMDSMVKKWTKIGLLAQPADRDACVEGVKKAYKEAGLEEPDEFIWVESPFQGAVAAYILNRLGTENDLWEALESGKVDESIKPLPSTPREAAQARRDNPPKDGKTPPAYLPFVEVLGPVWDDFFSKFLADKMTEDEFRDRCLRLFAADEEVGSHVSEQLSRCGYGQHDAPWLGFYDTFGEAGVDVVSRLDGLMQVSKAGGWWWPFSQLVVFSERPLYVQMDDEGKLHSERSPAIEYPDGFCVYANHGDRQDYHPMLQFFSELTGDTNERIAKLRLEQPFRIPDQESLLKISEAWNEDTDTLAYVSERSDHHLPILTEKKSEED